MSGPTNRVPAALPDDPNDVAEALEVAGALWEKGDHADAIRWVRRAAEAAADAGQTSRLAALARGAADLEQAAQAPPVEVVELHSQTRSVAPPLPPAASVPPPRPSVPPPLPSRPSRVPLAAPSDRLPIPAPSDRLPAATSSARLPLSDRLPAAPSERPSDRLSLTPSERLSVAPSERISLPSSSRTSIAPSVRPPPGPWVPEAGQTRVRVSVRASVRDGTLLVVRPLPDGEEPPPGTREAFLLLPEEVSLDDVHVQGSLG